MPRDTEASPGPGNKAAGCLTQPCQRRAGRAAGPAQAADASKARAARLSPVSALVLESSAPSGGDAQQGCVPCKVQVLWPQGQEGNENDPPLESTEMPALNGSPVVCPGHELSVMSERAVTLRQDR